MNFRLDEVIGMGVTAGAYVLSLFAVRFSTKSLRLSLLWKIVHSLQNLLRTSLSSDNRNLRGKDLVGCSASIQTVL